MSLPKIDSEYFPFGGGLDLMTPAIALKPGKVFAAQNYEPEISGGYRRIDGYERYDGQASPSAADYWVLPIAQTGTIAVGDTLTGASSGATCKVLAVVGSNVIAGRLTGSFTVGENLTHGGVVGTVTAVEELTGATTASDDADYALLAANDQRTNILAVPGSGQIRGVWVYKDVVYAFRDNVGATAGAMYKATGSGWSAVSLGREIQFVERAATVTITIATPGVVTWTGHGLAAGQAITLSTTGALPTGLAAATTYYVVSPTANTFQLSATSGGASIATSGAQSGTHTATLIGAQISVGDTITGSSSGATAVVTAALLRTGSWNLQPVGTLVFASVTGAFVSGEALKVGGNAKVQASTVDTAITRAAGGSMEFCNYNFTGSSTNGLKMYGCDSVNLAFEFDGTTYVPIRTGMTTDTPSHIIAYHNSLWLSFNGSVQLSALTLPYSWTAVLGAAEISTGDAVTGFVPQAGTSAGSTLAIFTKGKTYTLYGSTTLDFKLVNSIWDIGYFPFTMQTVSNNTYGMTARGIQSLITTLTYGDFDYASISHEIQTLINSKRGLEISSTSLHTKNQYRVYFSDGTGLTVGLTGDKINGILPLDYGMAVRCICTATLSTGAEVTYFGSDDGYVYQDNIGTSFDGDPIEAFIRLAFNHSKSPRIRKRFRRGVLEVDVASYSEVNVSYDLGYGSPNTQPSAVTADRVMNGGGGYWDQFTWDQFFWDSETVVTPSISIDGTEKNISMIFYSNRAQDQSHTLQGLTLFYTLRRAER